MNPGRKQELDQSLKHSSLEHSKKTEAEKSAKNGTELRDYIVHAMLSLI